jgi:hypothetical protein
MDLLLWNYLHKLMGNLPLEWGRHEVKGWSHNRLLIAIHFCFIGLYLMRKREETNVLPGIALALSVNR